MYVLKKTKLSSSPLCVFYSWLSIDFLFFSFKIVFFVHVAQLQMWNKILLVVLISGSTELLGEVGDGV